MASVGQRTSCSSLSRRRIYTTSYRDAVVSIARIHTETVNTWSHLLAALWFTAYAARFASTVTSLSSPGAAAVLTYLVANAFCFACSTLYHIFADHETADVWLGLDHVGIVCAIWASSMSFAALCPGWPSSERQGSILLVTAAAMVCCMFLFTGWLCGSSGRSVRVSTHVVMGSVAAVPALRYWHLHTAGHDTGFLADFVAMTIVNGSGGAIYASNLLDKRMEKIVGVSGASHQAMHVLAVGGALLYTRGLMRAYSQHDTLDKGRPL
jgi:adiponectin receptor